VQVRERTPMARACAMPNRGALRAHSGLKCTVKQILPPLNTRAHDLSREWAFDVETARQRDTTPRYTYLYILGVLPSSSGISISNGVVGYVTGI